MPDIGPRAYWFLGRVRTRFDTCSVAEGAGKICGAILNTKIGRAMKSQHKPDLLISSLLSAFCLVLLDPLPAHGAASPPGNADPPQGIVAKKQILDLTCVDCHESVKEIKGETAHYHGQCESCHGGADQHRTDLLMGKSGTGSITYPGVKECMNCHKDDKNLVSWNFSEHSRAEARCTDCHSFHVTPVVGKSSLAATEIDKNSANCARCHQDVAARFNLGSHHPLNEGAISCSSCHDPHGSPRTTLSSRNDRCLSCHQAVRGPMVFEHAPVVEDCMSCHDPHGAPGRRLLSVSQPMVCLQCHSIVQGKHGYGASEPAPVGTRIISGAVLRGCTNCHSAIHGSHQDPVLRY
jgi:DmsE family decaheme c-type cytochrome